jgi:membrane protein insertase Oxa1/YidC/SpoIIIJ
MKIFRSLIPIVTVLLLTFYSGRTEGQTLQDQFKSFYEGSSNWEDYKVIKVNEVNRFWKVVSDSLDKKNTAIRDAEILINSLEKRIDDLAVKVDETQAQLDESNKVNASISFLGISILKPVYHIFVWLTILGVIIVAILIYLLYMKNNSQTRRTLRDYEEIKSDFDNYREQSKQKQVLMKRDIQTVLNALEENNIKVSSLVGYRDSISSM